MIIYDKTLNLKSELNRAKQYTAELVAKKHKSLSEDFKISAKKVAAEYISKIRAYKANINEELQKVLDRENLADIVFPKRERTELEKWLIYWANPNKRYAALVAAMPKLENDIKELTAIKTELAKQVEDIHKEAEDTIAPALRAQIEEAKAKLSPLEDEITRLNEEKARQDTLILQRERALAQDKEDAQYYKRLCANERGASARIELREAASKLIAAANSGATIYTQKSQLQTLAQSMESAVGAVDAAHKPAILAAKNKLDSEIARAQRLIALVEQARSDT